MKGPNSPPHAISPNKVIVIDGRQVVVPIAEQIQAIEREIARRKKRLGQDDEHMVPEKAAIELARFQAARLTLIDHIQGNLFP